MPILLPGPATINTPGPLLGSAALPARLVPMKLPSTKFPYVEAPSNSMPAPALPEIKFMAAAVVPPIVLPVSGWCRSASPISMPKLRVGQGRIAGRVRADQVPLHEHVR